MFEEQIESLKELVYGLEEELEDGHNDEAVATLDFIIASCNSLAVQLKEA